MFLTILKEIEDCLKLNKSLKENKRELLVTRGAGDIDKLIIPIKSIYQ